MLTTVGVDADTAAMVGQLAGQAFSIGHGVRLDPIGTAVSLAAADTATLVLKAAGVSDQDALLFGNAVGQASASDGRSHRFAGHRFKRFCRRSGWLARTLMRSGSNWRAVSSR